MRLPGLEPGSSAWKAEILTTRIQALSVFLFGDTSTLTTYQNQIR